MVSNDKLEEKEDEILELQNKLEEMLVGRHSLQNVIEKERAQRKAMEKDIFESEEHTRILNDKLRRLTRESEVWTPILLWLILTERLQDTSEAVITLKDKLKHQRQEADVWILGAELGILSFVQESAGLVKLLKSQLKEATDAVQSLQIENVRHKRKVEVFRVI